MAKPRLYLRNMPNPEGPGDREGEEGGARKELGRGGEEGVGKEREAPNTPLPHPQTRQPAQKGPTGQSGEIGAGKGKMFLQFRKTIMNLKS